MLQGNGARTIDIVGLVRLRKHLLWSSNVIAMLGIVSLLMLSDTPEMRDAVYIRAAGVLAL